MHAELPAASARPSITTCAAGRPATVAAPRSTPARSPHAPRAAGERGAVALGRVEDAPLDPPAGAAPERRHGERPERGRQAERAGAASDRARRAAHGAAQAPRAPRGAGSRTRPEAPAYGTTGTPLPRRPAGRPRR